MKMALLLAAAVTTAIGFANANLPRATASEVPQATDSPFPKQPVRPKIGQEKASSAPPKASSFDKAIKETVVDLGASPYYPPTRQRRNQLRCHFFQGFVVKELDSGQKGDDWISIAPNDPAHPATCMQEHTSGETVIPDEDADAGYFLGVKGPFIFLEAADCFDMGCPFGVFEASTHKKVFRDQRRLSLKGKIADIRLILIGGALVMRYPRVIPAQCSLPQKQSECWTEIQRITGLVPQSMPKCFGYNGFDKRTVFGTSDQSDPSVVSFPVEVTIPEFNPRILPGPVTCWSAD